MVNRAILIGNVGKEIEVKRLDSGSIVAKLSVATSESYKDKQTGDWKENTEWHSVVVWGKLAESLESRIKKGQTIYVEGKITYRTYDSSEGKKYFTEIVAEYVRVVRQAGEGQQRSGSQTASSGSDMDWGSEPRQPARDALLSARPGEEDDLPF